MDYREELDAHEGFQRLVKIRDWYRDNVLFRWPDWMPGTKVLAWRLDKKLYLMQQAIENAIYSRRVVGYKETLKGLNDQCYRKCRDAVA